MPKVSGPKYPIVSPGFQPATGEIALAAAPESRHHRVRDNQELPDSDDVSR